MQAEQALRQIHDVSFALHDHRYSNPVINGVPGGMTATLFLNPSWLAAITAHQEVGWHRQQRISILLTEVQSSAYHLLRLVLRISAGNFLPTLNALTPEALYLASTTYLELSP